MSTRKNALNAVLVCFLSWIFVSCEKVATIHDAVKAGDMKKIQQIISHDPDQVNAFDDKRTGETPLIFAIRASRLDIVEYLLNNGAKVSIKDHKLGKNALDCVERCLFECTEEYRKSEEFGLKFVKKSDEAIAKRLDWLKENRGEEAKHKFLKIRGILEKSLTKEEAADRKV